ncbi:hypothetical protein [Streptomyces niveus]|uniref:hypothetical protein n=1 Tax=Streptomyces niveus TaxID=193462 RepID=UPI0035DB061D
MDRTDGPPEGEDVETPFRVRDVFAFGRSTKTDANKDAEPEGDEEPSAPSAPAELPTIRTRPTARVGRAGRADGHQVPDWWDPEKDIIAAKPCEHPNPRMARLGSTGTLYPSWCPDCATALHGDVPGYKPLARVPTSTKACAHPDPHAVRSRPNNQLVAFWCADCETQLPVPDDYDELDDEDNEEADDESGQGPDKVPAKIRGSWSLRGNGKRAYARPRYSKPVEKKSLVEWWTGRDLASRWLLYNGSALAAGFALGVPQFFTAEVAYLVATYDSWTAFYVAIWYGVAAGVWVWDYRSRTWFPPFALAARIPLISMIVGSLLYGTTSP